MLTPIGHVAALVRFPVKSMAGVPTEWAALGTHGLAGDRRFAFRRLGDGGDFPWLIASRLPELVLYHPRDLVEHAGEPLPTHVQTPNGCQLPLRSSELADELSARCGSRVEAMQFRNGIFDEGTVSIIAESTIAEIGRTAGLNLDPRRFRANILLRLQDATPFAEDGWVGGRLVFGDAESQAVIGVTARDIRCMMVNLDPDTAKQDARVLKAAVRLNNNNAGVYGAVLQAGSIHVGQTVSLVRDPALGKPPN